MNREIVIAKYINAVEKILVAFYFNIEPEEEDIRTVTLKTTEFTNALRELYLSNDKNKDDKYKVIFDVISKASFRIVKESFETNPMGTYWAVIIYNLEIASSHIFELHFKETHYYYPFPKDDLPPQQTETKTEQETIEMKPVLKPEAVQIVFDIIKDFFSPEQQTELKQVIETGNKASKKMLFKGNGNRLTDTFKKLIEHDFITGCQKQDLINWIISNFTFTQQNKVKAFIYDTVEKTISRNDNPCKSPLIKIENGQIQKFEQPRTKKYNKN